MEENPYAHRRLVLTICEIGRPFQRPSLDLRPGRTTIVTFLMVFLIQNTQNRDTEAMHIKLDELIRATAGAHNALLDLEELEQEKLDAFRAKYEALASSARADLRRGGFDTDTPQY
jgi:hypothetical protein